MHTRSKRISHNQSCKLMAGNNLKGLHITKIFNCSLVMRRQTFTCSYYGFAEIKDRSFPFANILS